MTEKGLFFGLIAMVAVQRFLELWIAKRNTRQLLRNGGVEFGRGHYWLLVSLHALFFCSLFLEADFRGIRPPYIWPYLLAAFILAQVGRAWVIFTMKGRWTTRVVVVAGESLVSSGPFRLVSHPNYFVVAAEILLLPALFGLYASALLFTIFNAAVLLGVRLPVENSALAWSQRKENLYAGNEV